MLDKGPKELIYTVAVPLLMYLSFSKFEVWFLLPPALYMLSRLRGYRAWLFSGFIFFFLSLLWIRIAMLDYGGVSAPIAYSLIALLSFFLALYQFGLTYLLWKLLRFEVLSLPFIWVGVEFLRSNLPYGGFPWLLTGELLVNYPFLKNYLSAGGVYLGSLVVLSLSLSPYLVVRKKHLTALLLIFLLPLPFIKEAPAPPKGVKIALIQPNVEEHIKLDERKFYDYLPVYWKLLDEVLEHEPDVIFLPESAFPFTGRELYSEGKKLLKYSERSTIVTGLIDIRPGEDWEPYNSVFVIKEGEVVDFYDKVKLLPFGEYVPFPFGFVKEIFGAIGGVDYVPGDGPRCLKVDGIRVGTPICFEISYFGLVRKISECSDLIAVLTNDGWFRDSDGTFQHFRHARVRAVENRKFVLWVNNTGPSAVISPEGKILEEIPYGKAGYIVYDF